MKHTLLITFFSTFLLATFLTLSCDGQSKVQSKAYDLMLKGLLSHTVTEISAEEAHAQQQTALFIDAREQQEYEVSHLRNAIHVGYDSLDLSNLTDVPKNQTIIVYCSVGYRSEKVSEQLKEQGFEDVSNLYGGIFEWKNRGFEVVDKNGATELVHAFDKVWGIWLKKGEKVY